MSSFIKVLTGIGFLIGLGIIIWNYKGAVSVIDSVAGNATAGIKTLQGRG